MIDGGPDYLYKQIISLEPIDETSFEIEGIRRKKAWLPVVEVPFLNDNETVEEYDFSKEKLEEMVTIFLSGSRHVSRALNEFLNDTVKAIEISVFDMGNRDFYGKYVSEEDKIYFDFLTLDLLYKRELVRAIVGLWAHEVGHAFTVPYESKINELFDKYSGKRHFEERDEIKDLQEDWADQAARAIGFEDELEALRKIPGEIQEEVMMDRGLLE